MFEKVDGKVSLNVKDKRFINELMSDSNRKDIEIGEALGYSRSHARKAVYGKRQKLKNLGVIEKYTVEINEEKFGLQLKSIVLVSLVDKNDIPVFEDTMNIRVEVRKCDLIRGEYDYLLNTLTVDLKELDEFCDFLRNTDMVEKLMVVPIKEQVFEKTQIPLVF